MAGAKMAAGVKTEHPQYQGMQKRWQKARDVVDGRDALIRGGCTYLRKLHEQDADDYRDYQERATFYNASWRTVEGMKGMLFRKPETKEVPKAIEKMLDDITMNNEPLHVFAQQLAVEALVVGRAGILVDYPTVADAGRLTVKQAEERGLRPIMARYTAENIINWRTERIDNKKKLVLVVLKEEARTEESTEFEEKTECRYRVLDLVDGDDGKRVYRNRVFQVKTVAGREQSVLLETSVPLMAGQPLDEIPFVFMGVDALTDEVQVPPLMDLFDLNVQHWVVSADYERVCHRMVPTAYITGYVKADDTQTFVVGSPEAWLFPDAQTRVAYLEASGSGSPLLLENLRQKEDQMAKIGARLLSADAGSNQTAMTAAIHHGGETAILAAIAQVLSMAITRALTIFAKWAKAPDDKVDYQITRDFFPIKMDAQTLSGLVAAWQAGAISQETLFKNLQAGEIIDDGTTFEEEQAKIGDEAGGLAREAEAMARASTAMAGAETAKAGAEMARADADAVKAGKPLPSATKAPPKKSPK